MPAYYLDTSALVKGYSPEPGSAWIIHLVDPVINNEIFSVRLTGVEFVAAVYRKVRIGNINNIDAKRISNQYQIDWNNRYQIVEIDQSLINLAISLIELYGLRGYDAVHLAAAVQINRILQSAGASPLTFISADIPQLEAAKAEGLSIDDPNNHP